MNPINRWQAAKQAAWLLQNAAWTESPTEKVLGYAAVSDLPAEVVAQYEALPFALVRPGAAEVEPEHTELSPVARVEVEVVTVGLTDMEGGAALVGGNRVVPTGAGALGHQGTSKGRGLYELEEVLRQALTSMDQSKGMLCVCTIASSGLPTPFQDGQYLSSSKLQLEIYSLGRDRFYAPPRMLTASGAAGSVALAWSLPAARWDTLGLELYYQAGATPPAYGAGTAVTLAASDTSKTVVTGAGTWSFALFRTYDETGNLVNERQSPATTASAITA